MITRSFRLPLAGTLVVLAGACSSGGSPDPDFKAFAPAQAVDSAAGTVTMLGITVGTDGGTRIRDQRDHAEPFNLSNVAVGDWLEVEADEESEPQFADEMEREEADQDGEVELEAAVDSVDAANQRLVVHGVTVDVSGAEFEGEAEAQMTEAQFLALLAPGTVVEVEGTLAPDGTLLASEVELENDEDTEGDEELDD